MKCKYMGETATTIGCSPTEYDLGYDSIGPRYVAYLESALRKATNPRQYKKRAKS